MTLNDFLYHLTFTVMVSSLQGGLHGFCGTGLRCNSLEWGAPDRRTRDPAKRGSGSAGDAATAFHGASIPLQGRTFLRKALLRPSAIPRRCAFLRTPKTAPFTPSSYRI